MKRESGAKPELYPQLYALIKNFLNHMPLFPARGMGRQSKRGRARIPAEIHYIILC